MSNIAADESSFSTINAENKYPCYNFSNFNITKNTLPITVIAIRIEAARNSSDFHRNSSFSLAYTTCFAKCSEIFGQTQLCLSIEQRSNIILGIFNTPAPTEINKVFTTISKAVFPVVNTINNPQAEIKAAVFMDTGNSDTVHFADNTIFTSHTLWLGNIIERTIKICNATALRADPALLITHNMYDKLDKAYQNKFLKSYYLFHICCFGDYQFS
ncbi:hypothetical protein [Sporomusa sp.]|uniref:hypothetical protein n=1 Tax=Sporomusa sp. TaxID=2078658 RepID=UPI002BD539AE|nr:hypothetical protein [Sporomusa sp.]HWR07587.1 hypothetical protein [Sporomusa sp.]